MSMSQTKKKINVTLINAVSSLFLQISLILSGLIIPKIILASFGSETNGLISSITQFLKYISLAEGGLGGVLMASLYKPLHDKNDQKISSIVKTASHFYRKIGIFFIAYTIILAIVYPIVTNTNFTFEYISSLIFILSIGTIIQYTLSLSIRSLLMADKKVYIVSFCQIVITIFSIIFAYISVKIYPSVHLLKILTGMLYFLQPIVFRHYAKKYYKIDKNAIEDKSLIKNRWDGFAVNIAAFIHNCTDVAILTIFTDLQTVSVYSIYALVTTSLKSIIQSISKGITPTIGHSLASEDKKKLNHDFDLFEIIILSLVFIMFSVASLLITPFVQFYTSGIVDADYYQPLFGILLLTSEALYLLREHHVALAYSANKFKEITIPCYIEAGLNIIASLILVNAFGLIGVTIGTIIAMTYRTIYHIFFTKKLIGRPIKKFLKNILLFSVASAIGIAICIILLPIKEYTLISLIMYGLYYVLIIGFLNLIMIKLFYKKQFKELLLIVRRKK